MTQDRSAFEQDVHRAWADHLGYPIALASQSGTTILPEAKHAGDKLIALWRIGARTFAQVDPQLADAVRRVAEDFGFGHNLASGPSLGLGVSETTLLDMTGAYAGILNGGRARPGTGRRDGSSRARARGQAGPS